MELANSSVSVSTFDASPVLYIQHIAVFEFSTFGEPQTVLTWLTSPLSLMATCSEIVSEHVGDDVGVSVGDDVGVSVGDVVGAALGASVSGWQ